MESETSPRVKRTVKMHINFTKEWNIYGVYVYTYTYVLYIKIYNKIKLS